MEASSALSRLVLGLALATLLLASCGSKAPSGSEGTPGSAELTSAELQAMAEQHELDLFLGLCPARSVRLGGLS